MLPLQFNLKEYTYAVNVNTQIRKNFKNNTVVANADTNKTSIKRTTRKCNWAWYYHPIDWIIKLGLGKRNREEWWITQEAELERVAKAKRCWGLMVSLALTKRTMACLMASKRVSGPPLGPVTPFISTIDWGSMSTQKSISSLSISKGCRW